MSGLFNNPANWELVDSLQGQKGGINPLKAIAKYTSPVVYAADAAKDWMQSGKASGSSTTGEGNPNNTDQNVTQDTPGNDWGVQRQGGRSGRSGRSGSGSGSGYSAADIASLGAQYDTANDALRRQLGIIDSSRQTGLNELNNTYMNQLNQGNSRYGTQSTDNAQAREKSLSSIDNAARTGYEGLRRLLGLSGSANQSALENAKQAVARDASGKRSNAIDTYGRNDRDIDIARGNFQQSLREEKEQKEKSFLQSLLEQSNSLQQQIGENAMRRASLNSSNYDAIKAAYQPSQAAIDANNAALNDITTKYATPLQTAINAPELAQYTADQTAIDAQNQFGSSEDYSPYSTFLLRKRLTGQA